MSSRAARGPRRAVTIGHPQRNEVLNVSDFKDKAKALYAAAYEELATLEGVDAMDPLAPEHPEPPEAENTEEVQESPQ